MTKRRTMLIGAAVAAIALGSLQLSAAAKQGVNLVVNGHWITDQAQPTVEKGTMRANLRAVAEALGATVTWDSATDTATVESPGQSSMQNQIRQLTRAVQADTADRAAETYEQAVKDRNGALQYALMTEQMQAANRKQMEDLNWVTGVSSPWMKSFTVKLEGTASDGSRTYQVTEVWTDSTQAETKTTHHLKVVQEGDNWKIAADTE